MILTFERKILLQIVAAVENGSDHKVPYTGEGWSCPLETTPGLLLVGDDGVYIIGNNESGPDEPLLIAYANEANERRMDFYAYRRVKEASFGGDDGAMFLDLETVKSKMLEKAIPFIDLTPESYALGCVDSLDELFEEPIEKAIPVIEINNIDEMIEADREELYDVDSGDEEVLLSYRHYQTYAQVPFDFAVKEMHVHPDNYDYRDYYLQVDIFMNPKNFYTKVELANYGELRHEQMLFTQVLYNEASLCSIAVNGIFDWHRDVERALSENSYQLTCEFNPDRLPDHVNWEGFQKLFKDALAEISPKSTLSFKTGDSYCFKNHEHYSDDFLQFLVYRWLMDNRPQIKPQCWLAIHTDEPNNCFSNLISDYYGWPECEVNGYM